MILSMPPDGVGIFCKFFGLIFVIPFKRYLSDTSVTSVKKVSLFFNTIFCVIDFSLIFFMIEIVSVL